jgi:hypothetical protein
MTPVLGVADGRVALGEREEPSQCGERGVDPVGGRKLVVWDLMLAQNSSADRDLAAGLVELAGQQSGGCVGKTSAARPLSWPPLYSG